MKDNRPQFKNIKSYDEFLKYYWYRNELSEICKNIGIENRGTKQELNDNIKKYFSGNIVKKEAKKAKVKTNTDITENTPLLECGFSFNAKFREYFSKLTGIEPFKFTADMGAAWRKVKKENDRAFTIKDMLDIYNGKSDYAKYDNSVCQWNRFLKDFCADKNNRALKDKLKTAAFLWKIIRNSDLPKVYSETLMKTYKTKITELQNIE